MSDPHNWKFACGHRFLLLPFNPGEAAILKESDIAEDMKDSPDRCPDCMEAFRDDKQKAQEAINAHKAYAEFLKVQVTSVKYEPALKAVVEKMLDDCKLLWASKVKELESMLEPLDQPVVIDTEISRSRHQVDVLREGLEHFKLVFEVERMLASRVNPNNPLAKKLQDRREEWEETET